MDTKIRKCDCKHEYQDRKYGPEMRVHNPCRSIGKKDEKTKYRCTVCGKTGE
jgi:hypothetical protein